MQHGDAASRPTLARCRQQLVLFSSYQREARAVLQRSLALIISATLLTGCAGGPPAGGVEDAPPRVILFIGDGVGTAYWPAAQFDAHDLAVQECPVDGRV